MPGTGHGGNITDWGAGSYGLEGGNSASNAGIPPPGGQAGANYSRNRQSGIDYLLFSELQNCANRLGCAVGVYNPDYIVQEW